MQTEIGAYMTCLAALYSLALIQSPKHSSLKGVIPMLELEFLIEMSACRLRLSANKLCSNQLLAEEISL